MTAPTRDEELAALRRPFGIAVACVLLAVVAIGLLIARFGSGADRPAGVAERWLVAVGDTTREGIEDDGRARAEELGLPAGAVGELYPTLLVPAAREDGERAFESVRVGRATETDVDARVPFTVTPYEGDERSGVVHLTDEGDGWRVTEVAAVDPAAACDEPCGFPIERPERAPIGWFAGALALGVLITLGCIAAVRAATPTSG